MEDAHKHFAGNVAQKVLIEHNGKVLVCRGVGDEVWELPGGRLHDGETPVAGIRREIQEELGLALVDLRPFQIERNFHFKTNRHQVFIVYIARSDTPDFKMDSGELEEVKWITKDELRKLPMFDDGGTQEVIRAYVGK
jgi:8-oxo-dGTP diphosphatase